MPNEKNIQQVERIREDFQNSEVVILTEYQGLTVEEITELRDKCREAEIQYKVYKNTLINVVAEELEIEGLEPYLQGNNRRCIEQRSGCICKDIKGVLAGNHDNLKIKGGILGKRDD